MQTYAPTTWLFLILACAALAPGCGGETGPPRYPVHGQVLYHDQPVAEAMIVFHPLHQDSMNVPRPVAFSDSEGRFALTTLTAGDGAPSGEYAITVELRQLQQIGEEVVRDGRNLLPAKYSKPEATDLRYTVIEGANEVPPLRLSDA